MPRTKPTLSAKTIPICQRRSRNSTAADFPGFVFCAGRRLAQSWRRREGHTDRLFLCAVGVDLLCRIPDSNCSRLATSSLGRSCGFAVGWDCSASMGDRLSRQLVQCRVNPGGLLTGIGVGLAIVVGCIPAAIMLTIATSPLWSWLETAFAIEAYGHSGPAEWCYLTLYFLLVTICAGIWLHIVRR